MSIASVVSAGSTLSSGNSGTALSQLGQDYDRFMKLLVAQVKYQDPLAPMESTEFVSQIAQLTQVEQAVLSNKHMEGLRDQLALSGALFETALIGRDVTVPTANFALREGVGKYAFEFSSSVKTSVASIYDESGKLVREITLGKIEGGKLTDMAWDGTGTDGAVLPDGNYTVKIVGDGDAAIKGKTYASHQVTGVEYRDGQAMLRLLGGGTASAQDIIRAG